MALPKPVLLKPGFWIPDDPYSLYPTLGLLHSKKFAANKPGSIEAASAAAASEVVVTLVMVVVVSTMARHWKLLCAEPATSEFVAETLEVVGIEAD